MSNTTDTKQTPIVSILGHVDHGKTTILDQIRSANAADSEAGGITQKISVFTVKGENIGTDTDITFIDTPGHEAFDLMRTRGGNIADIVLLIVAADDGLMPQTRESIEIIKQSAANPIVVINKVDLPNTDIPKIKRELATLEIQIEEFGGNVPVVEVSGKTGAGIDTLLETIALVVDIQGLVERETIPDGVKGKAYVLESIKDKSKGNVSSIVLTQGSFNRGDFIAYAVDGENIVEKVKGFVAEDDSNIVELQSGYGAKVIGLSHLVGLGSELYTLDKNDKKVIKELLKVEEVEVAEDDSVESAPEIEDDWLTAMMSEDDKSDDDEEGGELNVMLKTGSEGSMEALLKSVRDLDIEGYTIKLLDSSVGDITMKDVEMAQVTKSIILGFEVSIDSTAQAEAQARRVGIRTYDIIYKLTEELEDVLTMMATPTESEEDLGSAEIKQIFTLSNGDKVLGGRVLEGLLKNGAKCYVVRDDEIVSEGRISSLKRNKDEIKEATKGTEFGAIISPTPKDVVEGDEIHAFKVVKV